MKRISAPILLALTIAFSGIGSGLGGTAPIDEGYAGNARMIARDLEFFLQKFRKFAAGSTEPLFSGRSLPTPPETCSPAPEPRRFGILIGADDPGLSQFPEVLNDVDLLTSALLKVGAAPEDVHRVIGERATREGVVEAAWNVLSQLACGDKVFVYFGGAAETMDRMLLRLAGTIRSASSSPRGCEARRR